MSAATGTILTIAALGASTGAGIYGAKKGSDASKKAAAQQEQSAQQALALRKQMYETTRGDLEPYRTQGGQGLTALSSFLGMPAAPAAAPTMPNPAAGAPGTRPMPPGATPIGPAVPRVGPTGMAPLSQVGGAPGSAPGMVLLRAPTGQTQPVPADQVDYYLARGATRG